MMMATMNARPAVNADLRDCEGQMVKNPFPRKIRVYVESCKPVRARSFATHAKAQEYAESAVLCPFTGHNHTATLISGFGSDYHEHGRVDANGYRETISR